MKAWASLDHNNQPVNRAFNAKRVIDRGMDELIGLCKGVLADGEIAYGEVTFLAQWLEAHTDITRVWPANVIHARITEMITDGALTPEGERELMGLLIDITGGTPLNRYVASMSTGLPLTHPAPEVIFENQHFCLTGEFLCGPRKACESEIEQRGGTVHRNVTLAVDYLVIGAVSSRDWIHSTYGRKIEAAVKLRDEGRPINIISEEHWAKALGLDSVTVDRQVSLASL
jgi:NAD-dependent DNA ligase